MRGEGEKGEKIEEKVEGRHAELFIIMQSTVWMSISTSSSTINLPSSRKVRDQNSRWLFASQLSIMLNRR